MFTVVTKLCICIAYLYFSTTGTPDRQLNIHNNSIFIITFKCLRIYRYFIFIKLNKLCAITNLKFCLISKVLCINVSKLMIMLVDLVCDSHNFVSHFMTVIKVKLIIICSKHYYIITFRSSHSSSVQIIRITRPCILAVSISCICNIVSRATC